MMRHQYFFAPLAALALLAATPRLAHAQTGGVRIGTAGTPDPSAVLDVSSTSQGLLAPRLTEVARLAMGTGSVPPPAAGLLVYQTNGATPGFYYNAGSAAVPSWQQLATASGTAATASNGLTRTGTDVQLGGTLTKNTVIAQNGNSLSLAGSTQSQQISQLTTDDASTGYGAVASGNSGGIGQSFTLPAAASITQIYVYGYAGSSGTFQLYQGTPGGPVLAAQSVSYNAYPAVTSIVLTTPVSVDAGTYSFSTGSNQRFTSTTTNPYPNGDSYSGNIQLNGRDLKFVVYYLVPSIALHVSGTGAVGVGTASPGQKLEVAGQIFSSTGGFRFPDNTVQTTASSGADNLGNHTATQNLNLAANQLVGNGGSTGLAIASTGAVTTAGALTTGGALVVNGSAKATNLAGTGTRMVTTAADGTLGSQALPTDAQQLSINGSTLALTNGGSVTLPTGSSTGDNLGNHTATQALNLGNNALVGNGGSTGLSVTSAGSAQLPAASAYTYAAAKAYSITYGISDLLLEDQPSSGAIRVRTTDANGAEFVYANRIQRLPIHLPQGATVTTIKLYLRDADATDDIAVYLNSVLPTDTGIGAPTAIGFSITSGSPGYTALTLTPSSPVISSNRAYFLQIIPNNLNSTNLQIGAIRVNYTVTQAE